MFFFIFISPWDEYLNKIMTRLLTAVRLTLSATLAAAVVVVVGASASVGSGRNLCVCYLYDDDFL